jgi:WXG100 family type VII secretion target
MSEFFADPQQFVNSEAFIQQASGDMRTTEQMVESTRDELKAKWQGTAADEFVKSVTGFAEGAQALTRALDGIGEAIALAGKNYDTSNVDVTEDFASGSSGADAAAGLPQLG